MDSRFYADAADVPAKDNPPDHPPKGPEPARDNPPDHPPKDK